MTRRLKSLTLIKTERWKDRWTDLRTDIKKDGQTDGQLEADRQTDKQTDMQKDTQTDRQNRETKITDKQSKDYLLRKQKLKRVTTTITIFRDNN